MASPEEQLEQHFQSLSATGQPYGLLFDCDGTLIDTMPGYYRDFESTLAELKMPPLPPARFYSFGGMAMVDIFNLLISEAGSPPGITAQVMEATKRKHHELMIAAGKATPPGIKCVIDIARKYKALNIPMAVASSGWRDHVVANLKDNDCLDLFDAIVTADDPELKNGKPAPDIFLLAAKKLNLPASSCIGFEDAPLGMQSLISAKCHYACDVTKFYEYPRNAEARAESK